MCNSVKLICILALTLSSLESTNGAKSSQNRRALYRGQVDPDAGGKIPESYKYRKKLNQVDASALRKPDDKKLAADLKDTYLPDKNIADLNGDLSPSAQLGGLDDGRDSFSFTPSMIKFPSSEFGEDFSFNPAFDAHKITNSKPGFETPEVVFPGPSESSFGGGNKEVAFNSLEKGSSTPFNFGGTGIKEDKPHLYTQDPYAQAGYPEQDLSFKPAVQSYKPEPHEPEPYVPPSSNYHEPEPYRPEPEPYRPPTSSYHEPESYQPPYEEPELSYEAPYDSYGAPPISDSYGAPPISDSYGAPPISDSYGAPPISDSYGAPPYKPIGPILLEKRPYEPTEIKPVIITIEEKYTSFDCRKVPYQDKYYADPEAGCRIYHFCNADGRQETFNCGYGTVFNEYLGTCDHSQAVHCKGGEGFKPPTPHYKPPTTYHRPEPYHKPEPYHESFESSSGSFGFGNDEFRSLPRQQQQSRPRPRPNNPSSFGFESGFGEGEFRRPARQPQQQQQQDFGSSGLGFENNFGSPEFKRPTRQQQQPQQLQSFDNDELGPGFGFESNFDFKKRSQ